MYCAECGIEMKESNKFCPGCGWKNDQSAEDIDNKTVGSDEKEHLTSITSDPDANIEAKVYEFEYSRGLDFGRKTTKTKMVFTPEKLVVEQQLLRPFRKTKSSTTEIEPDDLVRIRTKNGVYFWEAVWAVVCFFLGFAMPLLFLGIPVLIFIGFHRDLVIQTRRGILKIPAQYNKKEFEEMIDQIKLFNTKLIIQL